MTTDQGDEDKFDSIWERLGEIDKQIKALHDKLDTIIQMIEGVVR